MTVVLATFALHIHSSSSSCLSACTWNSWRSLPLKIIWSMVSPCNKYVINMHFVHFANVIGCKIKNMLMLKLEHLFYLILHVRAALAMFPLRIHSSSSSCLSACTWSSDTEVSELTHCQFHWLQQAYNELYLSNLRTHSADVSTVFLLAVCLTYWPRKCDTDTTVVFTKSEVKML